MRKIVLTGGPGGGKSTAINHMREYFEGMGYAVGVVRESATELIISLGETRRNTPEWVFQTQLLRKQIDAEDRMEALLRSSGKPSIMICDRGALDGQAFCTPNDWWTATVHGRDRRLTEKYLLQRYDHVIFLHSAANCGAADYQMTEVRQETPEEALAVENRLKAIWSAAESFAVVEATRTLNEKIEAVIDAAVRMVDSPSKKESATPSPRAAKKQTIVSSTLAFLFPNRAAA